jgi:hypothetical protein
MSLSTCAARSQSCWRCYIYMYCVCTYIIQPIQDRCCHLLEELSIACFSHKHCDQPNVHRVLHMVHVTTVQPAGDNLTMLDTLLRYQESRMRKIGTREASETFMAHINGQRETSLDLTLSAE